MENRRVSERPILRDGEHTLIPIAESVRICITNDEVRYNVFLCCCGELKWSLEVRCENRGSEEHKNRQVER